MACFIFVSVVGGGGGGWVVLGFFFFFQAEDGIRDRSPSRGLGDVYKRQHVQGIIAAMENIKVRNLFLPDNMEGSEWRAALENTARENGTTVHYISQETLLTYSNGMTIRIIPPSNKTGLSDDENDTSYVYYVEYNGFSATFTGDMSAFAEKNLIDDGKAGKTDLLKVAHHGSNTATCEEWVEKLTPEYAVISVGENNPYNLPNDDVPVSYTHLRAHETDSYLVCRLMLEKKKI